MDSAQKHAAQVAVNTSIKAKLVLAYLTFKLAYSDECMMTHLATHTRAHPNDVSSFQTVKKVT